MRREGPISASTPSDGSPKISQRHHGPPLTASAPRVDVYCATPVSGNSLPDSIAQLAADCTDAVA